VGRSRSRTNAVALGHWLVAANAGAGELASLSITQKPTPTQPHQVAISIASFRRGAPQPKAVFGMRSCMSVLRNAVFVPSSQRQDGPPWPGPESQPPGGNTAQVYVAIPKVTRG
jgi:hypothetical protein